MDRDQTVLAALAADPGSMFEPVQIQKLMFLIDKRQAKALGGAKFDFQPYDYGPFDSAVYRTLESLAAQGLVAIGVNARGRRTYTLTTDGTKRGEVLLGELRGDVRDDIAGASSWVRRLSFAALVSAIYQMYPEMRANSVFQGR